MALLPMASFAQADPDRLTVHRAAPFDAVAVAADDARRDTDDELRLYARHQVLGITSADGVWETAGDERICRLAVASPGAKAMGLLMEAVAVPPGARIRMVDMDGRELRGFAPVELPDGVHEYATPPVQGDAWVLEYREPVDAPFQGGFAVPWLSHAYRDVGEDVLREGPCHVNVACSPERDGWESEIDATVRISVVTPQGSGWCSGTLVNNVRQDCAPYILTAWHCGRLSTTAQFNQYQFFFNFQYATCAGGAYSLNQVMTGAQLKAFSDDYAPQYQGVGGSDFMLLRTNAAVPASFDPYWAGWDATNIANVTQDGVSIHHPTGAPKRISTFTQTATTGHPMASSGLMTHYKLKWAQTTNGFGVTEQGSSGAGLFKPHATAGPVLIGTLTGSSSGTNCTNNQGTIYYGKMSYHWTNNPNTAQQKLKAWLDPDATGTLVLAGSRSPCTSSVTVPERSAPALVLRPNPASDRLHIDGVADFPLRWTIFDASGRTMSHGRITGDMEAISLTDLSSGMYILQLDAPHGPGTRSPFMVAH